jgi:hypothetical protein
MTQTYYEAFATYLQSGDTEALKSFLDDGASMNVLSVYRNGFYKACIDALSANYPIAQKLLTESLFSNIAKDFIEEHPPKVSTLVGYGEQFPEFLANRLDNENLNLPIVIPDIAKLDRAWIQSLNSANDTHVLSADTVLQMSEAGVDPTSYQVNLNASVQIIDLKFNEFELWQDIKLNDKVPTQYQLSKRENTVMFWREEGQVIGKPLNDAERFFF